MSPPHLTPTQYLLQNLRKRKEDKNLFLVLLLAWKQLEERRKLQLHLKKVSVEEADASPNRETKELQVPASGLLQFKEVQDEPKEVLAELEEGQRETELLNEYSDPDLLTTKLLPKEDLAEELQVEEIREFALGPVRRGARQHVRRDDRGYT